jgi:hypothetical protein
MIKKLSFKLWLISIATIVSLAFPAYAGTNARAAQKAKRAVQGKARKAPSGKVGVAKLRSLDQLKEAFQRDQGKVRFVTILSPT